MPSLRLADDDGAVVVPVALAPQIIEKAGVKHAWEDFTRLKLSEGGELSKYYPLNDEAKVEYRAWRKENGLA